LRLHCLASFSNHPFAPLTRPGKPGFPGPPPLRWKVRGQVNYSPVFHRRVQESRHLLDREVFRKGAFVLVGGMG
jgi:hypothetical protein